MFKIGEVVLLFFLLTKQGVQSYDQQKMLLLFRHNELTVNWPILEIFEVQAWIILLKLQKYFE